MERFSWDPVTGRKRDITWTEARVFVVPSHDLIATFVQTMYVLEQAGMHFADAGCFPSWTSQAGRSLWYRAIHQCIQTEACRPMPSKVAT